jgi:hypothetical protein
LIEVIGRALFDALEAAAEEAVEAAFVMRHLLSAMIPKG